MSGHPPSGSPYTHPRGRAEHRNQTSGAACISSARTLIDSTQPPTLGYPCRGSRFTPQPRRRGHPVRPWWPAPRTCSHRSASFNVRDRRSILGSRGEVTRRTTFAELAVFQPSSPPIRSRSGGEATRRKTRGAPLETSVASVRISRTSRHRSRDLVNVGLVSARSTAHEPRSLLQCSTSILADPS